MTRIILLTGHKQGIGAAIKTHFEAQGDVVVGFDLPERDITQYDALTTWVQKILDVHGKLDVLVNNAGICPIGALLETSLDCFDAVFAVNIKAPFALMQAVLPHMIAAGRGVIVNIASDQALIAKNYASAYGASKAALAQLTKSTALDYAGAGIRVNAVCPGSTETPLVAKILPALKARYPEVYGAFTQQDFEAAIPQKRFARAEEIAHVVYFLASEEAQFITGSLFSADGGYTAQ